MKTPNQRAVLYIRVSTDQQADEGMSLDTQRAKLRAYCLANDLTVAAEFCDAGISGKSIEPREGLQSALKMLREKKADILLVVRLDRLSRSTKDTLALAEQSQRECWSLASLCERIDTSNAAARLSLSILASLNQYEREKTSEITRLNLLRMAQQNLRTGAVPFGYRLDPTDPDNKRLLPNEDQQETLRRIKHWRRCGNSFRNICDRLKRMNFRTAQGNDEWNPKTIYSILKREAKLGKDRYAHSRPKVVAEIPIGV